MKHNPSQLCKQCQLSVFLLITTFELKALVRILEPLIITTADVYSLLECKSL